MSFSDTWGITYKHVFKADPSDMFATPDIADGRVQMEQTEGSSSEFPPGWYPERGDEKTLRYWNGEGFTEQRIPAQAIKKSANTSVILSALALGFSGVAGGIAIFGAPILLFPLPLGFGIAGLGLCIAAFVTEGPKPWYLALAVIAAIAGIAVGIDGYNQFSDASEGLRDLQESLGP